MRHAPSEASARLLDSLGVAWRTDPRAPRCENGCDHPACRENLPREELDALRILIDQRTRDGVIRTRAAADRAIERGVRVVRDPRDVNLLDRTEETDAGVVYVDRKCRTEGCENRANARYDRGAYFGLCWEKCIPVRREVLSAGGRKRHGLEPAAKNGSSETWLPGGPPPRTPAPLPVPPPPADPVGENPSFADVAEALEAARETLEEAEDAFRDAVERFVKHPVYVALRDEIARAE